MTAAEQLAQALARVIEEALAKRPADPQADAAMTCAQAAEFLGYSDRHVRELARTRAIPTYGKGRARRFLRADLEAYRRRNRTPGRTMPEEVAATSAASH